jgi:hypothetical protein
MLRQKGAGDRVVIFKPELFPGLPGHIRGTGSLTTHLPLLPKPDIWLSLPHPVKLTWNGALPRRMGCQNRKRCGSASLPTAVIFMTRPGEIRRARSPLGPILRISLTIGSAHAAVHPRRCSDLWRGLVRWPNKRVTAPSDLESQQTTRGKKEWRQTCRVCPAWVNGVLR